MAQTMARTRASLSRWKGAIATYRALFFGGTFLAVGLSPWFSPVAIAQVTCDGSSVAVAEQYESPVDLGNLSPAEQEALAATVAERQVLLPYRFLSLRRCPSLSNQALYAFENQDYGLCLELLDRAISEDPQALTHWLDRAMVHYYLGEEEAARADAQEVRSRFTYPRSHRAQEAYRQLMIQLDGKVPDPRRAVKVPNSMLRD